MTENRFEVEAENVRTRINSVLKEKGITENSVAAGDSSAQSRLNSQLSHGKRITLDTVLRILNACPDISADWLLRGSGEMYLGAKITGANSVTGNNATVIGQQTAVLSENFVREMLAEKDRQIQILFTLLNEKISNK